MYESRNAYHEPEQDVRQLSAHDYRKRILEEQCRTSLANSLRTTAETNEMARTTAQELKAQGEQIQRIQRDTEETAFTLDRTEYVIKGMKSWFGAFTNLFTSAPTRPESISTKSRVSPPPERVEPAVTQPSEATAVSLLPEQQQGFDREMASNLGQLSSMLGELRQQAIETGYELRNQNQQLETVSKQVASNDMRLQGQRKDLEKLNRR